MRPSALKEKLAQCRHQPMYRSDFSIGHRGAAMQFPEHTKESYQAAIDSGAGIVECDVTFTKDKKMSFYRIKNSHVKKLLKIALENVQCQKKK